MPQTTQTPGEGKAVYSGQALVAVLPALLLLGTALWTGTFQAPLFPWRVLVGHGALALFVAWMTRTGPHSLVALDWGGRAAALLLGWLVVGVILSPVPRAGLLPILLLPMFLLLPRAVANCWRRLWQRRLGLWAVALVSAVVASISLWHWAVGNSERAALPLGHHNLLALWLVTLLPLLLSALAKGPGWSGFLALTAALPAVLALLASGSLSGLLGCLACLLGMVLGRLRGGKGSASPRWGLRRWGAVGLSFGIAVSLLLLLQGERLQGLASGDDSSWAARSAYWQGAWGGSVERPWGWGAGSTAWTLSRTMPVGPGVLPPGDVVADVHSLPLALLYELGWPGLLLVGWLVARLWRYLWRHLKDGGEDGLRSRPALLSLLAFGVAALAGAPLSVMAMPTVLAVAVGSGLQPTERARWRWIQAWPIAVFGLFILPLDLAAVHYSRAIDGPTFDIQRRALVRAMALDPRMPLYRAQLAILDGYGEGQESSTPPKVPGTDPEAYLEAAEQAFAVAPLWLLAGAEGQGARMPWSERALLQACDLDPLSAMAPFLLAVGEPLQERSAPWGARALAAEPRLLAATAWRQRPATLAAAVALLVRHPSLDAGWRLRLQSSHDRILQTFDASPGEIGQLALAMDGNEATSLSLYAFRRRPWPADLVVVELDASILQGQDLVPLVRLRSTAPSLFAEQCLLGREGPRQVRVSENRARQ